MKKRVVITGMGAITPLGSQVSTFWERVKEGRCGIDFIEAFDTEQYQVKVAGEVKDFNPEIYLDRRETRRMDRYSQFAIGAAVQAVEDAKLDLDQICQERFGVIIGSGIGGIGTLEKEHEKLLERGPGRVSPLLIPMIITNMAAGNVAIRFGAKGVCSNVVTACATGTNAIGD
ncbi:MAG: beta-ketoacyl-[acyl-carrier-protein] synthase II, partial [Epulopiscium sp.]|nr:beta-ketoacyl-[acyl-carrier-protein] synthase II [Candidatus Epulonipiscium sp.]